MQLFSKKTLDKQTREALVSLTALHFIEDHALLGHDQLDDAKKSLQALFLRTSGEETMLRKLIDILKTTRRIHQSFASIGAILNGVATGLVTLNAKVTVLRDAVARFRPTAEENADFIGPFLSYSQTVTNRIEAFHRLLNEYLQVKENESRQANFHRIAREARMRLKQRLTSSLASEPRGDVESKIRQEVVASFDYSEAEANLKYAQRESAGREREVRALLADLKALCEMSRNPAMRAPAADGDEELAARENYEDVFTLFTTALQKHPRLFQLKDAVVDLFKLYQHSYGMYRLDFENLNQASQTMIENTDAYFEAREEDRDLSAKRDKLRRIEGLIPFLEDAANAIGEEQLDHYAKYSKHLSAIISRRPAPWDHITEELLRAKVQAEAELSTRL
jgi:hypothetical protein